MPKKVAPSTLLQRYGIAEWYGKNFMTMTQDERLSMLSVRKQPCPFQTRPGKEVLCTKRGGVCSLRMYEMDQDSGEVRPARGDAGIIATTCPARFLENDMIFKIIGSELVNSESPLLQVEVPYLVPVITEGDVHRATRTELHEASGHRHARLTDYTSVEDTELYGSHPASTSRSGRSAGKGVGVIDYVLVNASDYSMWCALEVQAVYFSGDGMDKDYPSIRKTTNGIAFPGGKRRPDYRSSGPKRLMPQLQIKVPSLRRWGKKLAVLVDKGFWFSLGKMNKVDDVSNSDIVWFVVDFVEEAGAIRLVEFGTFYTTLEQSIEGLTAGEPVTLREFEKRLRDKLDASVHRSTRSRTGKKADRTFDIDTAPNTEP